MTDSSSEDEIRQQILSPQGIPIPPRITWRDRWISIWRKTRMLTVILAVFVAGVAAFLTNIEKIQKYFGAFSSVPTVPPIVVEVTNSSSEPVDAVKRGDFFLWLPGPDARYTFGKFELRKLDGTPLDSETFTVPPFGKVRLLAHVLNQNLYGRILPTGGL